MGADRFVWYELVTSDLDAALSFYGKLLGWTPQEYPGGAGRYVILNAKGKGVGGAMPLPAGMSQPFWLGYVGTRDIDAAVSRFKRAAGTIHRGPWEIPQIGRVALVSDPQGVGLALIQGTSDQPSEAFNQRLPGHGNWHELHTSDPAAALRFYSEQFGWTAGDALDMGLLGTYQMFKADDVTLGGIRTAAAGMRPTWLYYFGIENVTQAAGRIKENGGSLLHEPQPVPGGALIITARDPQGALFALVGPG
jgi:predicted enzyme related to lactoylglutathione lyase